MSPQPSRRLVLAALVAIGLGCRAGRVPGTVSATRMGWEPDAGVTPVPSLDTVPSTYVGRWVEGSGVVMAVPSRDAFWIGDDELRLLVVLQRPTPLLEIIPGDRVRVSGRLLSGSVEGALPDDVDPDIRLLALQQDRFLLADAEDVTTWNVDAVSPPPPG